MASVLSAVKLGGVMVLISFPFFEMLFSRYLTLNLVLLMCFQVFGCQQIFSKEPSLRSELADNGKKEQSSADAGVLDYSQGFEFVVEQSSEKTDGSEQFESEQDVPESSTEKGALESSLVEHSMPIEAGCPEGVRPCPNFGTRFLFELELTRKPEDSVLYPSWSTQYKEILLISTHREFMTHHGLEVTGAVHAYSTQNGKRLWKMDVGQGHSIRPVVTSNGIMFMGVCQAIYGKYRSIFYGIDIRAGRGKWGSVTVQGECYRSASVKGNTIYLVDHDVRAIDGDTGKVLWSKQIGKRTTKHSKLSRYGPVIGEKSLFAFNKEEKLFAFDLSGNKKWDKTFPTTLNGWVSMALGKNDNLYVYEPSNLHALTAQGSSRWKYPILPSESGGFRLSIDLKENIYVGLQSISRDGKRRWIFDRHLRHFDFGKANTPLLFEKGAVYCGNRYGEELWISSKEDGTRKHVYVGYPSVHSKKTRKGWYQFHCLHMHTAKNEIIGVLESSEGKLTTKYMFVAIDLKLGKVKGYWPGAFGSKLKNSRP